MDMGAGFSKDDPYETSQESYERKMFGQIPSKPTHKANKRRRKNSGNKNPKRKAKKSR